VQNVPGRDFHGPDDREVISGLVLRIGCMLDINAILNVILSSAIPESCSAYRRPLTAALGFFLDHLAPDRASAILGDQWALSPTASNAERLFVLARRSPILHKLGQVLARDRRLDVRLRETLQRLESMPSCFSVAELRPLIERELGDLDRHAIALEPAVL